VKKCPLKNLEKIFHFLVDTSIEKSRLTRVAEKVILGDLKKDFYDREKKLQKNVDLKRLEA